MNWKGQVFLEAAYGFVISTSGKDLQNKAAGSVAIVHDRRE